MDYIFVFVLSDNLPWVTEAIISIHNYAPGDSTKKGEESKRRKDAVNAYVKSLIEMWSKAFGSENIMERKAVAKKIRNGLAPSFNKVYNRQSQLSRREQVKQWRQLPEVNQQLDTLKETSKPELFREDEENFYYEQKKITRIGYLNEEIDIDYDEMEENRQKENQFQSKEDEEVARLCEEVNLEVSTSDVFNSTFKSTASSVSMNRSGILRFEEEEKLPQAVERPQLRKIFETFTEEVKAACVSVSSKCSISAG